MWDSQTESVARRDYENGALSTCKSGVKNDGLEQKGNSWYVATDIPSDLLVRIGEVSFHLHKYPLLSRSGKISRIVYESRKETELKEIALDGLPGGPEAFELAAKFCYGIAVDLTASNISGLRCAAEYLEMTEELEEGNLVFKTEAFLSYVVFSSWRDSIVVLKSCENLSPWAENLQIVRRCSESIAWKARANPKGIRWQYTRKWNEMKDSSPGEKSPVPPDWWFEDVSVLRVDHFVRVITVIQVKGMKYELIGAVISHYAAKWLSLVSGAPDDGGSNSGWKGGLHMILPGNKEDSPQLHGKDQRMIVESLISIIPPQKGGLHMILPGNKEDSPQLHGKDQRMIVESLISIIPPQKDSVSCSFLLRLLRLAMVLKVAPALVTELEKRVGMQFEQATMADLLIPSYNKNETFYDVDLVQRLLEHFVVEEQSESLSPGRQSFMDTKMHDGAKRGTNSNAKMRVAKLVDSFLTEVARDRNLSLTKFRVLAEALPESARSCDDGLYRAVDSYLKAHPTLTEYERKRLCRVMDCQKLSIDACMHAAKNERLPLRVILQVLFSEQVKINNAIANGALKEAAGESHYQPLIYNRKSLLKGTPRSFQEGWEAARKDINTLKLELESAKTKYLELQNDMEALQRPLDKLAKPKQTLAWITGWKKLSKLAKITENNDIESNVDTSRKTRRRWRNSIS